jgi:osmotically inducible protein OsmC
LPELLDAVEAEPLQDELSAVRVLLELLGFSLRQFSVTFILSGCAAAWFSSPDSSADFRLQLITIRSTIQRIYTQETIMERKASAVWKGGLKDGKGSISAPGGVLNNTQYSFTSRFENGPGTNPEELIAAAHAACFSMALSAQLGGANLTPESISTNVTLTMEKLDSGWTITASHIDVVGKVPGADAATFQKYAEAAEKGCPVSKVLNAKISMTAKLG